MKILLATLFFLLTWNISNAAKEVRDEFCKNEGKGIINEMRIINQQYKLLFGQKNISDIHYLILIVKVCKFSGDIF